MKCIYCGKELNEGSLFCPNCGKEVQIVPDYNIYDDDYLNTLLKQEDERKAASSGRSNGKASGSVDVNPNEVNNKPDSKKKQKIIIAVAVVLIVLVLVIVLVGMTIRKNHANSFDYQIKMAESSYDSGKIDDAILYYENALALDKDNIEVRLTLADIYMEQKDYDSALVLYQEVIQSDSKNEEACRNLITIYEKQQNTDAILTLADAVDDSIKDLFADYMVTPPEFSVPAGTYDSAQSIILSTSGNYQIFYTTDGSDPIARGILYTEPIDLSENNKTCKVQAVCMNDKEIYSDVVSNEYTIQIPAPDMPIVTPDGGDFGVETTVTVTVPEGCSAYYTWDGSTPNAYSSRYIQPLVVPEGNNVLSVIIIDNNTNLYSDTYRGNFVYYSTDYSDEDVSDVAE